MDHHQEEQGIHHEMEEARLRAVAGLAAEVETAVVDPAAAAAVDSDLEQKEEQKVKPEETPLRMADDVRCLLLLLLHCHLVFGGHCDCRHQTKSPLDHDSE